MELWCTDPAAAKAQYGPIASWDTSEITDMVELFYNKRGFNEDISRWDVSSVTDMVNAFRGATSFNRQLGGSWAQSTANKYSMFYNSPGSIEGKTKNAIGTPV